MNERPPTLRAAVVGTGYLGRFHAQKYAALPGVELVAVVDSDGDRARAVADECGCRAETDLHALAGVVDCASVVVPNTAHFTVARTLLNAGIHVLLEKPLTSTVSQADALIGLAERRRLILQAGHLERYNPSVQLLLERTAGPLFVEAHRLGGFKNRATDVDVVLDLMVHDIDIVLALVGRPVREVRASGHAVLTDKVDIANARLEFEGGATANLTASRVSLKEMRKIRVFAHGAYLAADCAARENVVVTDLPRDPTAAVAPEVVRHEPSDHLLDEIADFLAAVRGEKPVTVDGRAGREAVAVALQVMEAIGAPCDFEIPEPPAGADGLIANDDLAPGRVPPPDADWDAIGDFALTIDGYAVGGGVPGCQDIMCAPDAGSLTEMRTALFAHQRSWRQEGNDPDAEGMIEVRSVLEGIRRLVQERRR